MVGLGRMGQNMVWRLSKAGHEGGVPATHAKVIEATVGIKSTVATITADVVKDIKSAMEKSGGKIVPAANPQELVSKLKGPRAVWLMIPAGITDKVASIYAPLLSKGDALIDGGNSYYIDDIRRAKELKAKGIDYIDVGTSGGVWGLDRGYCMMIGGEAETVKHLDPIFATLAPGRGDIPRTPGREKAGGTSEQGYLHCGPNGAGHFVKMVHNGIEYGLMQAYAEGFDIFRGANAKDLTPEI